MRAATIAMVLAVGLVLTGCRERSVDKGTLVERDRIVYEPDSEVPFTGKMIERFQDGRAKGEVGYRDGIPHGKYTVWYMNWQKAVEGQYRDGKREGDWIFFYDTGRKREEGTYRSGRKQGKWTYWAEDGGKQAEKEYEDGKVVKEKIFNYDEMRGVFWE